MRPVAVVVVDVDAEHLLKLSPADDRDPVEAFAADGADPALGECVRLRRPERRANDLDALASEDVIEGFAELAVAIVDQEADRCPVFARVTRRAGVPVELPTSRSDSRCSRPEAGAGFGAR
jgi:hypothetical protein